MGRPNLEELIRQSFDDQQFSRNESSVFRDLLEESACTPHQLNLLRNTIFAQAKEALRHPDDRQVLDWIDDLMRVMMTAAGGGNDAIIQEACFFPCDEGPARLVEVLRKARKTLDICVFTITDNRIKHAILDAHERGVQVRIISDNDKAMDRGSDILELSDSGVRVAVDKEPDHMHHKFAIVDQEWLLNGSFNWTRSASSRNYENITISNDMALIKAFSEEFSRLWDAFGGATA